MEFNLNQKLLPPGKKVVDKWAKKYKPKKALKSKKQMLFQEIDVWVGLREKKKGYIVAKVIHDEYIVYKVKNYYSILHRPTLRDILLYPIRLFKPHKKMKNMGYVKELAKKLSEEQNVSKERLLTVIREYFDYMTEIEKKADDNKKKKK